MNPATEALDLNNFDLMVEAALTQAPNPLRPVLSTKRMALHNEAVDQHMRLVYKDRWDTSEEAQNISDWILAATGNMFLRVAGDAEARGMVNDNDGAIYVVVPLEIAQDMFDTVNIIITSFEPFH